MLAAPFKISPQGGAGKAGYSRSSFNPLPMVLARQSGVGWLGSMDSIGWAQQAAQAGCKAPCARPVPRKVPQPHIQPSTAVTHPCFYGIDTVQTRSQLIARRYTLGRESPRIWGPDSLAYPEPRPACSKAPTDQGAANFPAPPCFSMALPISELDDFQFAPGKLNARTAGLPATGLEHHPV